MNMVDRRRMSKPTGAARESTRRTANGTARKQAFPGQVVLVLQGGGALGAYQVGVYEAMHEYGAEPDWVIGTSIGAINAALIAGNAPSQRLPRLVEFWARMKASVVHPDLLQFFTGLANASVNLTTVMRGIPAFFEPHGPAWFGSHVPLGVESAGYYSTKPLRATLSDLVDLDHIDA